MTLSDPLLKELKGHIITLLGVAEGNISGDGTCQRRSFGDDNETVFLLCYCLESIFLKGLVRYDGFTPWKADCFQWFYQIVRKYQKVLPLVFKSSFEDVLNDKKVKSHVGKTRLLIRTCLRRKCLHVPLQFHVENKDFRDITLRVTHRSNASILGHEILSEIFYSLLLQLSTYDFTLDLNNSAFLDESWQVPALIKVEMVPCTRLGLTLGFPLGFPVVVTILEHSAAAELGDQIEIGDILDEINGTCLRNMFGSKIDSLFKKVRSEPFRMTIIKGKDPKTSQVYLPIIKLYRILGLNPPAMEFEHNNHTSISNSDETNSSATANNIVEQDPILFDFSCDDDNQEKPIDSSFLAPSSTATVNPIKNGSNSPVNQNKVLSSSNVIDLILNNDNDGEEQKVENKNKIGNSPSSSASSRLPPPLSPLQLQPNIDLSPGEEVESPPHGFDRKQVPISKFYGEDGNQFIV